MIGRPDRFRRPSRRLAGALASVLLALSFWPAAACRNAEGGGEDRTEPPVPVQTDRVVAEEASLTIEATGTVEARSDVTVVTEAAGRVKKVRFELGDDVEEGRALVELDRKMQKLAVQQARAQLSQAEAAADLAAINAERMENLHAAGSASRAELDEATTRAKSAEAARQMAAVALKQAREALAKTTVTAPIAGRITLKMVNRGQTLAIGAPVAQVTDLSRLEVTVGLTEGEVADLALNQPVAVSSAVDPEVRCAGRIYAIGYKAVGPTRAFPVEISIDEPHAGLHPGMTVDVEIVVASYDEAVMVHVNDVFEQDGRPYVWVIVDGAAERRWIETGRRVDDGVIVTSGLAADERIVVTGGDLLREGTRVVDTPVAGGDR
jgi:RND family efflux transporter MFP subunit